MKKIVMLACVCGAATLAAQGAYATGIKVRGGTTSNGYTLSQTPAGTTGNPYAESTFSGTSLGFTLLSDDSSTYLDYVNSSGSGDWTGKYDDLTKFTAPLTRKDNAIVIGGTSMNASGGATNFYFGWKTGETTLGQPRGTTTYAYTFNTTGFIFGGGLGIPAAGGVIALSLGMGLMSGSYDKTTYTNNVRGSTTTNRADMALGFSYGIGYTYSFTPNVGVSVDYKGNSYNYTFDSGLRTEWSLDEKLNTTSASLFVKF